MYDSITLCFVEDYISEAGYWFEIDPDTDKVSSITVYVPEAENSEIFLNMSGWKGLNAYN